ncbi:hypothetical protein JYT86_00240 [bacterium AH-315-N03]|nr:hypothetical protein [bacterium AH-315-N03]
MFVEGVNRSGGMVVWLFTGRTNSDEDFESYCSSISRLNAIETEGLRFAVLVVDKGNPMPNARRRKKIAEVSRDVAPNTVFIMVGGALARGVVTAINWIRRPTYTVRTAATFTDAVLVAEGLAERGLPELRQLHVQVRGEVRDVA